jgi:hypothetical protein
LQAPSDAVQRSALQAVVKVLWRATTSDEEDPDCRAAMDAILHPPVPASQNLSDEAAESRADDSTAPSTLTTTTHTDTAACTGSGDSQGAGGYRKEDADTAGSKMAWPQVDVEFWQRVESMLDFEAGCAIVGDAEFTSWVASVLQCRPAL